MGSNIMVAGVILQMIVMVLYCFILIDFVVHYVKGRPVRNRRGGFSQMETPTHSTLPQEEVKKARTLLIALAVSTILIFIRSICESVVLFASGMCGLLTPSFVFPSFALLTFSKQIVL